VVKTADWIVDLGPEGGDRGGYVIAEGTPEQVAATPGSATGEYLARVLRGEPLVPLSAVTFAESVGHVRAAEPAPVGIVPLPEKRAAAVGANRSGERP
jgi:excinuclease ABC subunit A